jgi:molybdate transport system substrate-binding protein
LGLTRQRLAGSARGPGSSTDAEEVEGWRYYLARYALGPYSAGMLNPLPIHFPYEAKSRRLRKSSYRGQGRRGEVSMSAWIGLAVASLALLLSTPGWSADLRVMSGGAPQEVLAALTPEFENRTGHRVTFSFAVITTLEQRLASGERTDVVLMPVPVIDKLVHAGSLRAENRATLGVLGISVIVRQGAAKPDISTPDRLRQALLKARSVVHATPTATPSGAHMARVLEQLGIAEQMQSKVIHRPALAGGADLVARGEAELGLYPTSEVVHVPGVAIVGPLPPALQLKIVYGAAIARDSAAPEAAAAFIGLLSAPDKRQVWLQAGFEPPGS